jgi:hypothetical protein
LQNHSNHHQHHHGHEMSMLESDIEVSVIHEGGHLKIQIIDSDGNIPQLEETHEKFMHLIVVSNDLKEFHHLHPAQHKNEFSIKFSYSHSSYTAFVDLKPKGKGYQIKPIHLDRYPDTKVTAHLEIDQSFKKEMDGRTVELITDKLHVDEEVTLKFVIANGNPEPYLGALGHVVIIDQAVEQFIHVHPVSDHETIFKTHFEKPGLYKLWAEFKFDNQVDAYPFVFEIK